LPSCSPEVQATGHPLEGEMLLRQPELGRQMIELRLKGGVPLRVELADLLQVVDSSFEGIKPRDELGWLGAILFVQGAISQIGNGTTTTHGEGF
jgi:hypothetical protein